MEIKICGLRTLTDVEGINAALPDYAGFIINASGFRRSISDREAHYLRERLAPGIQAVGVFVDADPALIARLYEQRTVDIAQLHGTEDEAYIARLRELSPGIPVWKAFPVKDAGDVRSAAQSSAERILLDAGRGEGKPFDWSLLESMGRSYVLAGGLNAERIRLALEMPGVVCVDVSSGVETDGRKDPRKIMEAVNAARRK